MDNKIRGILEELIDKHNSAMNPRVDRYKETFESLIEYPLDFAFGFTLAAILFEFGPLATLEVGRHRISVERNLLEKKPDFPLHEKSPFYTNSHRELHKAYKTTVL